MRIRNTLGRLGVILSISFAGLLGTSATPAAAAEGAGAAQNVQCVGLNCVAVTLNTRIYPTGLGSDVVEFECTVTASGTAAATTVDSCSVGSVDALITPLSVPGSAVTTAGAGVFPTGSTVSACVSGHAEFISTVTGGKAVSAGGCALTVVLTLV